MGLDSDSRAAVISGASSGIGKACALRLDRAGFRVFAGVRQPADGEALRREASERLTPLMLDVTDESSIQAAAKTAAASLGDGGLHGLVNNAGVIAPGPLEFADLAEVRRQLEVNVLGQVAVIQAFLPLIREAHGRVVNIGSMNGYLAVPFLGPYSASKFAMEGLTDSLRRELRPWGIEVSIVEPGEIATPMQDKGLRYADEAKAALPERALALYGETIEKVLALARQQAEKALPPDAVARAVEHALTARRPRTRYRVGANARASRALTWLLPDRWVDALIARHAGQ